MIVLARTHLDRQEYYIPPNKRRLPAGRATCQLGRQDITRKAALLAEGSSRLLQFIYIRSLYLCRLCQINWYCHGAFYWPCSGKYWELKSVCAHLWLSNWPHLRNSNSIHTSIEGNKTPPGNRQRLSLALSYVHPNYACEYSPT